MCDKYAIDVRKDGAVAHDSSNSHTAAAHNADWLENTDYRNVYAKLQWDGEGEFDLAKACHDDTRPEDLNDAQIRSATRVYTALKQAINGDMTHFESGGIFAGPEWVDLLVWASVKNGLTSVTLPQGLTTIGDCAFRGCTGLTSVALPAGLTTIGNWAFRGCTGLTSVALPAGLTTIGDCAFHGCTGLTSVALPAGLTTIGDGAFRGCAGLTSVTLPDSLTTIRNWAFDGCTGLTGVTLPQGLTTIGNWAFDGCMGLTSVALPDGLTTIGDCAFHGCTGLTSDAKIAIRNINKYAV